LHGPPADDPQKFEGSGIIGLLPDQHAEREPLQSTNLGLSIQRDLVNGQMPLLCCYRGRVGCLSVVTAPVENQSARRPPSELLYCIFLEQNGNLSFPQVIPRIDRFHPIHETITRYSISVGHRTTHDKTYVEKGQQANLHPMSAFNKVPADTSNVYEVPRPGEEARPRDSCCSVQ
jgi:hypothetical protein